MNIGMKILFTCKKLDKKPSLSVVLREASARKLYTNFLDAFKTSIFMKIEQIFIKIEMTNLVKSNFLTGGSFNEFEALFICSKTFIFEINVLVLEL